MRCKRGRVVGASVGAILALLLMVASSEARGSSSDPAPDVSERHEPEAAAAAAPATDATSLKPTLLYTTPVQPEGLRAVIELHAIFLTGFLYYVSTSGLQHEWSLNYSWEVFERKLTGRSFGADHNHFGTNFIGHPLGGTGYYHAARSNRLGIYESAAFSFAGSLLWELFGEVREVISMNDTLVTPMAGWAIGESLFQLGAFFDRSGPETHNRVLGTVFSPLKSFNDWFDGVEPQRVRSGFPRDEWHRFDLHAGLAVAREDGRDGAASTEALEGRFRLRERLARLPHFDDAGRHDLWFSEANLSGIQLEGGFGAAGITDFRFGSQVLLAGHYARQATAHRSGIWGAGGVIGVGIGYEYAFHDVARARPGGMDRMSSVQPLMLVLEHHANLGQLSLHSYVDLAPSFGGVRSLGLATHTGDPSLLPYVLEKHGYYFGMGGRGAAALDASYRALALGAELRAEGYRAVDSPGEDVLVPIGDTLGRFEGYLGYRVPGGPVQIRATLERRLRGSRVQRAHQFHSETSFGLMTGIVF